MGEDWGIGLGRDRSGWLVHNPHHDQAAAPRHLARGAGGDNPAITGLRVVLAEDDVLLRRRNDPLAALSAREREVLALMAEGRSTAGIARRLWVTEGTVEKHVRSILTKLTLPETADDHRRVLAVLTFLDSR